MTTEPQALPDLSDDDADVEVTITGAPETIWLNLGDLSDAKPEVAFADVDEVSWCAESQDAWDVMYIRADALQEGIAAGIALGQSTLTAQPVAYISKSGLDGFARKRHSGVMVYREPTPDAEADVPLYAHPAPEPQSEAPAPAARPSDDQLWDQTLAERDRYHDIADDLAAQIAAITGQDIGEHSSGNDPWKEAMLAADEFIAVAIRKLCRDPQAPTPASEDAPVVLPLPDSWLRWSDAGSTAVWNEESMREYGDARVLADRQSRAQPSTREAEPGWSTIAVNEHFAALMAEIDHAARKGQLSDETCDIWAAFNYRAAAAALDIKAGS